MKNKQLPRIYQMETTNYCSAKCSYCPHSKQTRKYGFVSLDTVHKVADYCKSVDQHYIALHHMGEPLLHKNIAQIIQIFNKANVVTELSTNGSHIHLKGEEILKAGIGLVRIAVDYFYNQNGYIERVCKFLELAKQYPNTKVRLHTIVENNLEPFKQYESEQVILEHKVYDNWAGQVDGESKLDPSNSCYFLDYNYVVVLWDGTVSTCCLDFDGKYTLGNINTIKDITNKPCELCKTCNKLQFAQDGGWTI